MYTCDAGVVWEGGREVEREGRSAIASKSSAASQNKSRNMRRTYIKNILIY